jgi:hypothetical protein
MALDGADCLAVALGLAKKNAPPTFAEVEGVLFQ